MCAVFILVLSGKSLMDRGIFRGENEETASLRYELVDKALHSPLLEKSEDVANAIWQGVQKQKSDVLVGTAKLWNASFQVVPNVMKRLVRKVFGMNERQK
jgi:short-subunit dehydrogenase